MAGLGCFIKDTALIDDIKDIMQTLAASSIENGNTFSVREAYKFFRDNDVEIDLESTASIYEDLFDLNDANFNSKSELDEIVGKSFEETLDNLAAMTPKNIVEQGGEMSAGKRVAKTIANIFRNANVTDNRTQTTIKMFEKMMEKAARRMVNKSSLPAAQKSPNRSFEEILSDAFDLDQRGVRTVTGQLNSAKQVFDEFVAEINNYRQGLIDKNADQAIIDQFDNYTDAIISKGYDLLLSDKENKDIIRGALIDGGFFREVNKNGVRTKVLDWKKLTNAAGSMSFLRDNVSQVLSSKGYTQQQIDRVNESLEKEYVDLRASIILKQQKALNEKNIRDAAKPAKELARRNKIQSATQSVDAKRLAQLYTYGLFDATPNSYENLMNSIFGMSDIDQITFQKLKVLGASLQTLYSQKLDGNELSEVMLKSAINSINEQIGSILRANASSNSKLLMVSRTIQSILDASLRFVLTGLKNMFVQNPLSGKMAKVTAAIQSNIVGSSDKALEKQNKKLVAAVFKDMVLNGGMHYGDVNSTFVNRGRLDEVVNNLSDNKLYHAIVGTAIGRTGLDGFDSRFKASLTEKYLIHNLLKILTNPTNPNRMSKEDALNYVSEKLTGNSYEQAENQARAIITKINNDAGGVPILNTSKSFVTRLANDIVKAQLMSGGIVTQEQIEAAYNAAYRAAGRDLGHVPNNFLSVQVNAASNASQRNIDRAVKRKNYAEASAWTFAQMFTRNFANPFVGGATNWIVLKFEKGGLGLVTGAIGKFRLPNNQIDLTSDAGMRDLEERLYNEQKTNAKLYRGAVGAASSLVMYGLVWGTLSALFGGDGDDEERKKRFQAWRLSNRWLSKYTDEFTPDWMLAELYIRGGEPAKYISNAMGMNDNYSAVKLGKDAVTKWGEGDVSEGWGKMGEAVGTKLNAPVPAWRLVRDIVEITGGIQGIVKGEDRPPVYGQLGYVKPKFGDKDYKEPSRTFLQGMLKQGFFDYLGANVKPAYTIDALPTVSGSKVDKLKELGIKDVKGLKNANLENLRYKDKNGKKVLIFDKSERETLRKVLNTIK